MEIWKDVIGYEGIYSVSNIGNVRRDKAYATTKVGKIIKPVVHDRSKYLRVALFKDCIRRYFYVHVLVANAFIGIKQKGMEVNHIDANKSNPRLENLEYLTHKENMEHSFNLGYRKPAKGLTHGMCKLNEQQVIEIRKEWAEKNTAQRDIAKKFSVNQAQVWRIIHRKTWVHI